MHTLVSITVKRSFSQSIELLYELVMKDLKLKYKKFFFKILMIILQPLLLSIIFVGFKHWLVDGTNINKLDYISMFVVIIPWQFFVICLQRSVGAITSGKSLIYRVKFPIILLILTAIISTFVDSLVNIIAVFSLFLIFKKTIFFNALYLLLILLIASIFISALCIFFALIHCFISEMQYLVSLLTRLSLFVLPIFYDKVNISETLFSVYSNIPIVWMIYESRKLLSMSFFSYSMDSLANIIVLSAGCCFLFYLVFKKYENLIVDHL